MIILGLDPGTAKVGWGIISGDKKRHSFIACGVIKTSKKTLSHNRLKEIYCQTKKLIAQYKPELIVIEKLFFFKNLKTALPVSEARGVLLLLVAEKKIKLKEFTPLQVKTGVCGYGRAEKKQVQRMVQILLKLKKIPQPDDASDALALAICASFA
ncbi:crossover junction endodeoxyribonuclease RuvC [bacterium (Candidatus Gribaldobacteria) CG23_combo_of_CG06-09_8_20_14_all_37_87_8]|uniref:Crossover junction endodeoxyribonuclease RuvC n=2 Tax=Candidatus Gribaldobacteria TaxID=2798536 RepID=A0A2G9ZE58_9BACT|nr:MAG: crossover junction endodeoxyribonuclease RuvC [Parcubacteria group bacterium CG1_02_37_13]PIP31401.1 MAG: crossover junction endodeoxyribonuclease RuvC [bacterium (Candidatus Gribaldobacteria) CG23_combo_of_CG06-09_8_20_14_all_37_87_8]PIR89957.1 MAG: crossover junction endodeoxyribonuclease RuvC [bacterium (Candidatus Gribaldobacteria) CG10_big_fil_rev_8_21_14_0_10_37_21]